MGTLYYGDNLDILRRYLKDKPVNLAYLAFKKAPESKKKHGHQAELKM